MKKSPFIFLSLVSGGLTLQSCYHTREVTTVQRDPNDSTRTVTYYEDDDVYYHPYFHIYYNYGWSYWNGGGYYNYCENHNGWFHHRHDGAYANNNGHVDHHRGWSSGRRGTSPTASGNTTASSRGGFGHSGSSSASA